MRVRLSEAVEGAVGWCYMIVPLTGGPPVSPMKKGTRICRFLYPQKRSDGRLKPFSRPFLYFYATKCVCVYPALLNN